MDEHYEKQEARFLKLTDRLVAKGLDMRDAVNAALNFVSDFTRQPCQSWAASGLGNEASK